MMSARVRRWLVMHPFLCLMAAKKILWVEKKRANTFKSEATQKANEFYRSKETSIKVSESENRRKRKEAEEMKRKLNLEYNKGVSFKRKKKQHGQSKPMESAL